MKLNKNQITLGLGLKWLGVLIVLYFLFNYFTKSTPPVVPLSKVGVQKPVTMPITQYVEQTGSLVAYNSVNLVARVEGYLQAIKFTDGTNVKKDQLLFVIQPEPYEEKLKEAQAHLAAQKASSAYTKSEYARQQRMYKQDATSLNSVESWLARMQESEAQVLEATANEQIAKINYSYTHVLAPFDGRIGRHVVDVGNLVGNGVATVLSNIEQINPIYVYFNLNELDLIQLRKAARAHGFKPEDINQIPVYVKMQNESTFKHEGKLDFVNTGLNASTGTMEFRALLDNQDLELIPGLFVTVRVPLSKPNPMLTVPDTAVLYDQIGAYLLVVGKGEIVEQKRVVVGQAEQGRSPIKKGIGVNDRVIVSGLQFATPDQKVVAHDI